METLITDDANSKFFDSIIDSKPNQNNKKKDSLITTANTS